MKKICLALVFVFLCVVSTFSISACNFLHNSEKPSIVCTTYSLFDWVNNILGDEKSNFEVTYLMKSGVDMHSFESTASTDDFIKISTCDMIVFVGGESDQWLENALSHKMNSNMQVVNLLQILGDNAKQEEQTEGMQPNGDEEEPELDEHVWLSLKNAKVFCNAICQSLCKLKPSCSQQFEQNNTQYTQQIDLLDAKFEQDLQNCELSTILVADRFPFRYLVDDYRLSYFAAFAGCSAETDASFETVVFLSQKIDELSLAHIFVLEGSNRQTANAVVQNSSAKNAQILTLNSIQSINLAQIASGTTYLNLMEQNLEQLKIALKWEE